MVSIQQKSGGEFMTIFTKTLSIETKRPGDMVELTSMVDDVVRESKIREGVVHVFAPHATAVLALTEFESGLVEDIRKSLDTLVPTSGWRHAGNAHSHLKSMLLAPDKILPVRGGKAVTGTWQSLFFIEANTSGRTRRIEVTVMGE